MRQRAPLPMPAAVAAVLLAGGVGLAGSIGSTAVVAWPPSAGLVVGEVVTGGASASDEFAEIYNASAAGIDLGGLELVYVTSSGSTVTRKATWVGGTVLPARSHLLVANSAGVFASLADAVYSGGFAATGGSLVLRSIGGTPIDSVAWGDAANAFVEGSAAIAPPAGQSIERRPGGLGGNGTDTNANATDLFVNTGPAAQNLSAPPAPAPSVTPSPTPTVTPPAPTPSETPMPPATESPAPTETPTDSPTPTASPGPTTSPAPTPTESPVATPSPAPTVSPSPALTPSPAPSSPATPSPSPLLTVAEARMRANGDVVDVIATLTTQTGLTESGTGAFIQDATGGVALYLASADWPSAAAGTLVIVHGTVDDRYSQRTIRLGSSGDIAFAGAGLPPDAIEVGTGLAGEAFEGRLVSVIGRVTSGADALTDGFAVTVDDGSGPLRVVAAGPSGIAPSALPAQAWLKLTGPLGQRDSGGTGTAGYRLYLRSADDVVALPSPTPIASLSPTAIPPTPTPSATASATPGSTPTPTQSAPTPTPTSAPSTIPSAVPSASPSPSPAPTPATTAILFARGFPLGTMVTVQGTVTAEAGRIIDSRTAFLQDATAGIALHLPSAGWPAFRRGDVLRVTGALAAPYGNLEIRPATAGAISVVGSGALPAPRAVTASAVGESVEGLLVRIVGTVDSIDAPTPSGNFGVDLHDASGTFRVYVYATTSVARDVFVRGATFDLMGIEGQRAPSAGSTAGHRVWPRETADVRRAATPVPSTGPTPTPGPSPTPTPGPGSPVSIASAILAGGVATIAGTVTTPAGFVDADGRRVVLEDATGALLARFPSDVAAPAVGTRLIASGALGTYYGSPQLELSAAPSVTGFAPLPPRLLSAPPGIDLAWRLVRVSGEVTEVHRLGTTWRAELSVGGASVPIYGTARSSVPSTALVEGRTASVAGVVRPPYPSATDQRPAVAPRFVADVVLGGSLIGSSGGSSSAGSTWSVGGGMASSAAERTADQAAALDVELAELSEHQGERVRVGGLATLLGTDRIEIDDGTATAAIVLPSDAVDLGAEIVVGEALNAVGRVVPDGERWAVAPETASDIARVGSLGELAPLATPSPASVSGPAELATPQTLASHEPWPVGPLPTLVAVVGTLGMIAIRRREAALLARRALGALPSGGPIGSARDAFRAVRARLGRSQRA